MKSLFKTIIGLSLVLALPLSAHAAARMMQGGGSDGGGNTYRGKPLESYIKKPETLPAYQELIGPLLSDLAGKENSGNTLRVLKNLIGSVFSQKIWYFVPGPLEQIPPELLNSAVRTDQAALQGFDHVWVDEDIWNTMTTIDQARLLLHEAFMGLKILQFASPFRLCQAAYGLNYNCSSNSNFDAPISLTARDYTDVQRMTVEASMDYARMDFPMWLQLIQQNNLKYPYDWFAQIVYVSRDSLAHNLLQSTISGFMPSNGYNMRDFDMNNPPVNSQTDLYDYFQKHKEVCQIQAEIQGDKMHLKLSSKAESFDQMIPVPEKMESTFDDLYHEGRTLQRIGFSYKPGVQRPTGGYTLYNIWLSFDSYALAQVYVQEMVCIDKDCNGPAVDVKGGMMYICSDNGHLFKPL